MLVTHAVHAARHRQQAADRQQAPKEQPPGVDRVEQRGKWNSCAGKSDCKRFLASMSLRVPIFCLRQSTGQHTRYSHALASEAAGQAIITTLRWPSGLCDHSLVFVALPCGRVWSCVVVCGHVWSCVVTCSHVWSRVVVCGHVWSCVVTCGRVWSHLIVCGHLCRAWSRVVMCGHVWSCVVACGRVWLALLREATALLQGSGLTPPPPPPRDVLERGGGGGGWLGPPPPLRVPLWSPAEGGPKHLKRISSWHRRRRSKLWLSASNIGRGGGWDGVKGG